MNNEYKTSGELGELLKRDPQTIRNWSTAYAKFLSKLGRGNSKGATRRFDLSDQFVMATVAELTDQGLYTEEIARKLEDGYRIEYLPQEEAGEMQEARQLIKFVSSEEWLRQLERANILQRDIERISQERDRAYDELSVAQEAIATLRQQLGHMEGQLEEIRRRDNNSDQQVSDTQAKMQSEIIRLNREVARLEILLEIEKEKKKGET